MSDERDHTEEEVNRHIACDEEGYHICALFDDAVAASRQSSS